jgi:plasmid stabilization system protein ParE
VTRTLLIHPGATADVDQAAAYLNAQTRSAGNQFIVAADVAMNNARRRPRLGSPVATTRTNAEIRRVRVRPYDYQVVYVVDDDHVLILAVAHNKRSPYWLHRISE